VPDLTFRLFGQDYSASKVIRGVGDESDRTAQKLKNLGDRITPLVMAASALGPALLPTLAAGAAGMAGLGVAVVSGGSALGIYGAVAKTSFEEVKSGTKLAKKGLLDLSSPVGKATLGYQGLTDAWGHFVAANQPRVFAQMGAGVGILTAAIPKLQPLFNAASREVTVFENQLSHFVHGGGLDHLVGFLAGNAGPALESFRQSLTNVGHGVADLAPQFARFAAGVESGSVQISAGFARWAAGGGFQKFTDYVIANGPAVVSTLHDLAAAAVNIAKGLAPLGPVSLSFVGTMARLIATLPPGAITGIAAAFVSLQFAIKAAAVAGSLFNKSISIGPIGLATFALGGLLALFLQHSQKVADARAQTEKYRASLDQTTAAITGNTRAIAAQALEDTGALRAAQDFGIGLSTVTDAVLGNKDALSVVNGILDTYVSQQGDANKAGGQAYVDHQRLGKSYQLLSDTVHGQNTELTNGVDAQKRLIAATTPTTGAMTAEASAAAATARQMSTLATALLKVAGINLGVAQSNIQFRDSVAALTQSVQQNGRSLDINTVKGRANRTAILNSISSALQYADAVGKQTGSQVRAQQAFQSSIPAIRDQAAKLGLNRAQVDALIASIGGLRPKTVPVNLTGVSKALANLLTIRAYLDSIHSKTVAVTVVGGVGFKAGPGGPVGFQHGTLHAPPGWAMVGERGPEWMRFRGGEVVLPHGTAPGRAGTTVVVNVTVNGVVGDQQEVARRLSGPMRQAMRDALRAEGRAVTV
jgi:hypothetical protein